MTGKERLEAAIAKASLDDIQRKAADECAAGFSDDEAGEIAAEMEYEIARTALAVVVPGYGTEKPRS